jgi:hypothetical protein
VTHGFAIACKAHQPDAPPEKFLKNYLERRWIWRDVMTQTVRFSEPRSLKNNFPALCVMLDKLLEPYSYDPWG